jgi:hypothetical protein
MSVKSDYQSTLNACLCFNKKPKVEAPSAKPQQLMLTINGLQAFPAQFASPEFIQEMYKRRLNGIRLQKKEKRRNVHQLDKNQQEDTSQQSAESEDE